MAFENGVEVGVAWLGWYETKDINHHQSINTIMDVVAAKKGGELCFNLWPRKCAECLKFMT
jgi:hypothetical protein